MTQQTYPIALVTGAARRVGADLCRTLQKNNYTVVIHYNQSETAALALADELNSLRRASASTIKADLNKLEEINALASYCQNQYGRLDVLINNASTFFPTPLGSATETQWNELMNSNLKAPFFLSQKLAPLLVQTRGCIINISDIFARRPMPNHSIYSIAKAGNNMLTQALALELAPKVRVNGIAPGAILWPEDSFGNEVVNLQKLASIPAGRLGGTGAITSAALYLIRDASYTTGHILHIDGGRSLQQ